MENIHGRVLFLVKMQALSCNFTKSKTPPWVFSRLLNCANGTKLCNASQLLYEKNIFSLIKVSNSFCCAAKLLSPNLTSNII